ncbi:MAG: transposase [Prevotella sp.]
MSEFLSDVFGHGISEGTIQNIIQESSRKADAPYEEIRRRMELLPVAGADETDASVGKELHWNWIFQTPTLTYVYQNKSRGQKAIDEKFPNGLPNTILVTDRHQSYFNMEVKGHQVFCKSNQSSMWAGKRHSVRSLYCSI